MSAPAPSMLQKRLYTVLPRATTARNHTGASSSRSFYSVAPSTASVATHLQVNFFDALPPPPRSPIITANRLPIEAKGEAEPPTYHVPKPLALTSPHSNSSSLPHSLTTAHPNLFPYQSSPFNSPPHFEQPAPKASEDRKKPRLRYQLDVGAYGIAKKDRLSGKKVCEDASLAVQVGEDAYFVRDNAMGVADGVGGWARTKHPDALRPSLKNSSPSAAFARRLMHYCSSEASQICSEPITPPIPVPSRPKSPSWRWVQPQSYWEEELEVELEDLSDGIDVLMILQRAYDQTLKAHVAPPSPTLPSSSSPPKASFFSRSSPPSSTPLHVGSSTALLAILDQSPHTTACASANHDNGDAVIKIAHIGDCMGMLVRGEEIIWRSEEMWWSFNAPVQLGPTSTALPSDAQVFQFPVREDDILILASDGLSDNLWDEDVLDEVIRFRRSFQTTPECEDFPKDKVLRRRALAGMLSEALCSRAKRVSDQRTVDDIPFARRAREEGRLFRGGKSDDISVVVAVISPVDSEDIFETDDL